MSDILTEMQLEAYENWMLQCAPNEHEITKKVVQSHQELFAANAFLSYENLKLRAKFKEACQQINTRTPEGARLYAKLTKGMVINETFDPYPTAT